MQSVVEIFKSFDFALPYPYNKGNVGTLCESPTSQEIRTRVADTDGARATNRILPKLAKTKAQRFTCKPRAAEKMKRLASSNGKAKLPCPEPMRVPMNSARFAIVMKLMSKNKNFAEDIDMNDADVIVDHFKCLLILKESYLKNGHTKADKYPRYLKAFLGPGRCFSNLSEITHANRQRAVDFIREYVVGVKLPSQTINVAGTRMPAPLAPMHKQQSLVNKLTKNFLHGYDCYVRLLRDVEAGVLKLPDPTDPSWQPPKKPKGKPKTPTTSHNQ